MKKNWEEMSYDDKNKELFEMQTRLLKTFLEHRAITEEQYQKSLHDLCEKMGYSVEQVEDQI